MAATGFGLGLPGLGKLEAPEEILKQIVKSLPSLSNLMQTCRSLRSITKRSELWLVALEQLENINSFECSWCGKHHNLGDLDHLSHAECVYLILQKRDPRREADFPFLASFERFRLVMEYHQRIIRNVRSYYDIDNAEHWAPDTEWSYLHCLEDAQHEPIDQFWVQLALNERNNPARHRLILQLVHLSMAQDDVASDKYFFGRGGGNAYENEGHRLDTGSTFRACLCRELQNAAKEHPPGSDGYIKTFINDSVQSVAKKVDLELFGEGTFQSLLCHNYATGRIDRLLQTLPYQTADDHSSDDASVNALTDDYEALEDDDDVWDDDEAWDEALDDEDDDEDASDDDDA